MSTVQEPTWAEVDDTLWITMARFRKLLSTWPWPRDKSWTNLDRKRASWRSHAEFMRRGRRGEALNPNGPTFSGRIKRFLCRKFPPQKAGRWTSASICSHHFAFAIFCGCDDDIIFPLSISTHVSFSPLALNNLVTHLLWGFLLSLFHSPLSTSLNKPCYVVGAEHENANPFVAALR